MNQLESKFIRMGARLKLAERPARRPWLSADVPVSLDIGSDRDGEFFTIRLNPTQGAEPAEVEVLDVQPGDRHLLLLVRERIGKSKYLCGHDERHWFVAAVPESASVGTVRSAKEALKPAAVLDAQARQSLGGKARQRRKNAAFRRQGEWFFVPAPELKVDEKFVIHNEPIRRGNGGKPHWIDDCHRTGGQVVHVCERYPNGLLADAYRRVIEEEPAARHWGWRTMARDALVYVRGRVRHADHKTITLHGWHRVYMNTETQAKAMRNVAFLD